MDDVLTTYFAAWNEPDTDQPRRLLERCVTNDAQLIDPTGWWKGLDGLVERIGRYQAAAPGTKVVARGKVSKKYTDGGYNLVDCEIWLENANGEKTTPGSATVILPSRAASK